MTRRKFAVWSYTGLQRLSTGDRPPRRRSKILDRTPPNILVAAVVVSRHRVQSSDRGFKWAQNVGSRVKMAQLC